MYVHRVRSHLGNVTHFLSYRSHTDHDPKIVHNDLNPPVFMAGKTPYCMMYHGGVYDHTVALHRLQVEKCGRKGKKVQF